MAGEHTDLPGSTARDQEPLRVDPFAQLDLSPFTALEAATRVTCAGCDRSRRYWCGSCGTLCLPDAEGPVPRVHLPLRFEVVQARSEVAQKSTAGQATALAPDHVRLWRSWPECKSNVSVGLNASDAGVALLYPRADAVPLSEAGLLHTLVVIDAPWTTASVIALQDPFASMRCVQLDVGDRGSAFWRYVPVRGERSAFNPDAVQNFLCTVEAIHECCVEKDPPAAAGGEFDDLLWLFAFQHRRVSAAIASDPSKKNRLNRKSKGTLSNRF